MITATPARIAGVSGKKGSLVEGKDADIVIFDDQINIEMTIIKGRTVYNRQSASPQPLSEGEGTTLGRFQPQDKPSNLEP